MSRILTNIYGIFISIAILGGVVIFLFYSLALIIGGNTGANLVSFAYDYLVPYFIRAASVATMCGLLIFYVTGKHTLTMKEEKEDTNSTN